MASESAVAAPTAEAATASRRDRVNDRLAALRVGELTSRVVATSGSRRTITSPASGSALADLPLSSVEDVADAVSRAREAQVGWSQCPVRERAAVLLRLHDELLRVQDEVLDLIQMETGKSRGHAFEEVAHAAMVARWNARRGPDLLADTSHGGLVPVLSQVREVHQPHGVVGVIAPWNYPLSLGVGDALPALLAGNGVVIKPDPKTTLTALWAVRLLTRAGLPDGLVQVVAGDGPDIGAAVVDATDYVCFTGSTAAGRQVASRAAQRLVGCSLELGGKNVLYVAGDADLDRAADGAVTDGPGGDRVCVDRTGVEPAGREDVEPAHGDGPRGEDDVLPRPDPGVGTPAVDLDRADRARHLLDRPGQPPHLRRDGVVGDGPDRRRVGDGHDVALGVVGHGRGAEPDRGRIGLLGAHEVGEQPGRPFDAEDEHAGRHRVERAGVAALRGRKQAAGPLQRLVGTHARGLVEQHDSVDFTPAPPARPELSGRSHSASSFAAPSSSTCRVLSSRTACVIRSPRRLPRSSSSSGLKCRSGATRSRSARPSGPRSRFAASDRISCCSGSWESPVSRV